MYILGIIAIFLLDFSTKYCVAKFMLPGASHIVIKNFFYITYIQNPGAAFGVLAAYRPVFVAVTCALLATALFFYRKLQKLPPLMKTGLTLLIGGAAGNLADRLTLGYVIDFFDFRFWPVFNIADIAIVCGVFLIIYQLSIKGLPKD